MQTVGRLRVPLAVCPRRAVPPAAGRPPTLKGRRRTSWTSRRLPSGGPCEALPVALARLAWEWWGCAPVQCVASWTHRLTDRTGAHVDLSYTNEKLSVEDDAQEDDYLVDRILRHRPKSGSRNPDDIEFLIRCEKPFHHPKYDKWEPAESFITVYNKSWKNYCRSHGLLPKITKHLLAS